MRWVGSRPGRARAWAVVKRQVAEAAPTEERRRSEGRAPAPNIQQHYASSTDFGLRSTSERALKQDEQLRSASGGTAGAKPHPAQPCLDHTVADHARLTSLCRLSLLAQRRGSRGHLGENM